MSKKNKNEKFGDIEHLFDILDKGIDAFIPVVKYSKEMIDRFNEYPTHENRVKMEASRSNVYSGAYMLGEALYGMYKGLSDNSKEILSFQEFCDIVSSSIKATMRV